MKAPVSWLSKYADLGADVDARALGEALVRAGLSPSAERRTLPRDELALQP